MKAKRIMLAGGAAGLVNGLLGAGGGMVLVPLLGTAELREKEVFPCSVAVILPLCAVSLCVSAFSRPLPWLAALPYLLGAIPGGLIAGAVGAKIPTLWLHRILGVVILWGGIRYLCR